MAQATTEAINTDQDMMNAGSKQAQIQQHLSDSSSAEEPSPKQILENRVNDLKLFFTMCLAVCYVFSMSVVCLYFATNSDAFSGQSEDDIRCFARDDSDLPTSIKDP